MRVKVQTWEEVPEGALFLDDDGDLGIKREGKGLWVRCTGGAPGFFDRPLSLPLTILQREVPIDAVMEDLCQLAELPEAGPEGL